DPPSQSGVCGASRGGCGGDHGFPGAKGRTKPVMRLEAAPQLMRDCFDLSNNNVRREPIRQFKIGKANLTASAIQYRASIHSKCLVQTPAAAFARRLVDMIGT